MKNQRSERFVINSKKKKKRDKSGGKEDVKKKFNDICI